MSDYAIKILTARCGEVDSLLAAAVAAEDQAAEQLAALERQVEKAKADALAARTAVLDLKAEKEDLQGDIARLQETRPVPDAPELPPVPERRDPRTRDPLSVTPRGESESARRYTQKRTAAKHWIHDEPVDLDGVSPLEWERADLAYDLLAEAEGSRLRQQDWVVEMTRLLECNPGTAASIVSRSVAILQTVRRILFTGEVVDKSPIWTTYEAAPAPLLAAAGLGTAEDNFAGKTSTPPTTRQMRGHGGEESSGFETNRRRH